MSDPTFLLNATTAQVPLLAAYGALGVPSIPAGGSYLDPTTGVKVWKLSSNAYPAAGNWSHDYADGGNEISLPHTGATRTILTRQNGANGGPWWLIDFTPGFGVSNSRQLTGPIAPWIDLAFTFSNNPATPYYAYVASSTGVIRRFDIRTMLEVTGNGWPIQDHGGGQYDFPTWLHQSENDGLFVWMLGTSGSVITGYQPSTGAKKTYTNSGLNEPRLEKGGRYVGVSMTAPANGLVVWDWVANAVVLTTPGDPGPPFAHVASLRGSWFGVQWNTNYPPPFNVFLPTAPAVMSPGPANATQVHGSGNWVQPAGPDQWALLTHYGSLRPSEAYWLAPGAMILATQAGQRKILGHPYNATSVYNYFAFPKISPDGAFVLFASDMNGTGRSDVFLAELPGGTVIPPPVVIPPDTTPPGISAVAVGAITQVSAVVSWTTNEPADSQVEFGLTDVYGVLALDPAKTLSHVVALSGLAPGALHHYRVISRDAAGNIAKSLDATFTTLPVTVPPVVPPAVTYKGQIVDSTGKIIGSWDLK